MFKRKTRCEVCKKLLPTDESWTLCKRCFELMKLIALSYYGWNDDHKTLRTVGRQATDFLKRHTKKLSRMRKQTKCQAVAWLETHLYYLAKRAPKAVEEKFQC